MKKYLSTIFAVASAAILSATSAHAQATRTWVSGVGDDVNPCSRTAPCKTFAGAISKTATGGEINTLDAGAYGAVNIAARHPDVFGVAMGFSGYYVARGPVFGVDRAYADSNSPTVVVQHSAAARTVHYVLTVGAGYVYRGYTERFVDELRRLGVPTDYELIPGGGHGGALFWEGLLFGLSVTKSQLAAVPAATNLP